MKIIGRGDVAVVEKLVDGPDAVTAFEQMRREGVSEDVTRHMFVDRAPGRVGDGTLNDGLVR